MISTIINPDDIKKLRKRLGLTQQEFADILWVNKLCVARWEIQERECKGAALRLINLIEHYNLWDKI